MFGKSTAAVPIDLSGPIVLDLGEIRDEPVSPGWHIVTIERANAGLSRKKQIPKIFILSRVTDEDDEETNRTVIWNLMLAGDGLVFTKRCLAALGLPAQLNYPTYQALADDLIGREVAVKTSIRVHEGEKQVRVSNWKVVGPDIAF